MNELAYNNGAIRLTDSYYEGGALLNKKWYSSGYKEYLELLFITCDYKTSTGGNLDQIYSKAFFLLNIIKSGRSSYDYEIVWSSRTF